MTFIFPQLPDANPLCLFPFLLLSLSLSLSGQASHFFWGLWSLIQAKFSSIDFDFLGYVYLPGNCFRYCVYFGRASLANGPSVSLLSDTPSFASTSTSRWSQRWPRWPYLNKHSYPCPSLSFLLLTLPPRSCSWSAECTPGERLGQSRTVTVTFSACRVSPQHALISTNFDFDISGGGWAWAQVLTPRMAECIRVASIVQFRTLRRCGSIQLFFQKTLWLTRGQFATSFTSSMWQPKHGWRVS